MSLQSTDAEAAAVAKAPRVTLADIEKAIAMRYDTTGDKIAATPRLNAGLQLAEGSVDVGSPLEPIGNPSHPSLKVLSICILVMKNGFTVFGKSAPASPENFNADLGRKFAYEDAVRQLWPLMGFALREKLAAS
jgi:hypothetical protein